jgi:hypothetical protein
LLNFGITQLLNAEEFSLVWILVPLYAIPTFIAGLILGKKDHEILPLVVTGFKFHLITYIISNSVAILKHIFGFASIYENINTVNLTIVFWGLGLLLHFVLYKKAKTKTIKGINQSEIFE